MTRSKLKEVVEKGVVCVLSFSLSWEIEAWSWLFIEKKMWTILVWGAFWNHYVWAGTPSSVWECLPNIHGLTSVSHTAQIFMLCPGMNQGQASYILGYCFVFNFLYNVIVTGGGGSLVGRVTHYDPNWPGLYCVTQAPLSFWHSPSLSSASAGIISPTNTWEYNAQWRL